MLSLPEKGQKYQSRWRTDINEILDYLQKCLASTSLVRIAPIYRQNNVALLEVVNISKKAETKTRPNNCLISKCWRRSKFPDNRPIPKSKKLSGGCNIMMLALVYLWQKIWVATLRISLSESNWNRELKSSNPKSNVLSNPISTFFPVEERGLVADSGTTVFSVSKHAWTFFFFLSVYLRTSAIDQSSSTFTQTNLFWISSIHSNREKLLSQFWMRWSIEKVTGLPMLQNNSIDKISIV